MRQTRARNPNLRIMLVAGLLASLAACGAAESDSDGAEPPPIPEGVETVEFVYPETSEPAATSPTPAETPAAELEPDPETLTAESTTPVYWGVKEGEALTIMWEDLMPEGSEEELMREYEDFYAMLEKRYAANTTTLADAADPYAAISEGSEFDYMPQLGSFDTVSELNGELVRIPGYVVPFDFNSKARHSELLFVPYMGACIHTPPPPPNQIIFIRADPAIQVEDIWAPYWIEGTLNTEKVENELGDAAYAMEISTLEPYSTQ